MEIQCPHMEGDEACSTCIELHGVKQRLSQYASHVSLMRKYQKENHQMPNFNAAHLETKMEYIVDAETSVILENYPQPIMSRDTSP